MGSLGFFMQAEGWMDGKKERKKEVAMFIRAERRSSSFSCSFGLAAYSLSACLLIGRSCAGEVTEWDVV